MATTPPVLIEPGFKFPVIYEITRPVEDGEMGPDISGEQKPIRNLRGDKFWAKVKGGLPNEPERLCSFDDLDKRRCNIAAALVQLMENLNPQTE